MELYAMEMFENVEKAVILGLFSVLCIYFKSVYIPNFRIRFDLLFIAGIFYATSLYILPKEYINIYSIVILIGFLIVFLGRWGIRK
jgi:hypothetical protein